MTESHLGAAPGLAPSLRLLSALLRLYPRSFRRLAADGMADVFAARYRRAWGSGRVVAVTGLWWRTVVDVTITAFAERRNGSLDRSSSRRPTPGRPGVGGPVGPRGWHPRLRIEMEDTLQDLRYAMRTLSQRPAFTILAVITLALGIGANTAVFSIANGVLLKPVAHIQNADRLLEINRDVDGRYFDISYGVIELMREQRDVLEDIAAFTVVTVALGGEERTGVAGGFNVTGNYFEVLGVMPQHGRFFDPAKSFYPDVETAVVISDTLWQRRFGGAADVLGQELVVNGVPLPIIGVAPVGFGGHAIGLKVDLFIPIGIRVPGLRSENELGNWNSGVLDSVGLLAEGATVEVARQALTAVVDARNREVVTASDPSSYVVRVNAYAPLPGAIRGGATAFFSLLMVMMGLVLAIACVNVAAMFLSRAAERSREIAVRLALGASRRRLIRQLLTEALLLASAAAALGVVFAFWATRMLLRLLPSIPLPGVRVVLDLQPDLRVLGFAAFVALGTALLFGMVPALRATRPDLLSALKDEAPAGFRSQSRLRFAMTAAQMAITVLFLVGSGLFIRALDATQRLDLGFDPEGVWTFTFDAELSGHDAAAGSAFFEALHERVLNVPGVEAASLNHKLPFSGRSSFGGVAAVDADSTSRDGEWQVGFHNIVSPGHFELMRIPLLRGRDIGAGDVEGTPLVAVANDALAARLWPGGDAIGERMNYGGREYEIVGVVANVLYRDLSAEVMNVIYIPAGQSYNNERNLFVRMANPGDSPLAMVREIVREVDATTPILAAAPLIRSFDMVLMPQRVGAWVTGVAGFAALLLASVGIYGATAYAATRRTHEIGVRKALGADRRGIARLMVRQGMTAPAIGMAVGALGAFVLARFVAQFLTVVNAFDPLTFGAVLLLLMLITLAANLGPARRAARLDPVATLRAE